MPRITQAAKEETRQRILDEACKLFGSNGFDVTTTRGIAAAAGIATGTLFNYFPTKEAIVMSIVSEGLAVAREDFSKLRRADADLAEDFFLQVSTGLRTLKKHRTYIRPVLESALSPLATAGEEGESIRTQHLAATESILATHLNSTDLPPTTWHLYWTLYTGVLAFWADDASPKQEDTLALLDQSMNMFVTWLINDFHPFTSHAPEVPHGNRA